MLRTLTAFAVLALSGTVAQAAVLTADADTYIRGGGQATSANGQTHQLVVANDATLDGTDFEGIGDFKTYIRFDLSDISGTVSNATLALTFDYVYGHTLPSLDYYVLGLPDALGDDWDETTISWNNAPGNNPADYYDTAGFPYLGIASYDPMAVAAGDTMTFASAAFDLWLNNQLGADRLGTIVLISEEEGGAHDIWASRESALFAGPTLTFDLDGSNGSGGGGPVDSVVPLPASLWLLGGAMAGLAALRRRRGD